MDQKYWVTSKLLIDVSKVATIEVDVVNEPSFIAPLLISQRPGGKLQIVIDGDFPTVSPLQRISVQCYLTQDLSDSLMEHPDQSIARFKLGRAISFQ